MAITPRLEERMRVADSNHLMEVQVKLVAGTPVEEFRQSLPGRGLQGKEVESWDMDGARRYVLDKKYMIIGTPEEIRELDNDPQVRETDYFMYGSAMYHMNRIREELGPRRRQLV